MRAAFLLPVLAAPVAAEETALFQRYLALEGPLDQARTDLARGRLLEARRGFEGILRQLPDHSEAHFHMARLAYAASDFLGALAHLEVAERSLADLDRRYREEVAALKAQAAAEEAAMQTSLDHLTSVADPTGCSAPLFMVKRQALAYLEGRKSPLHARENPFGLPAEYPFLRGNALYRLGRREEALAQFRRALALDPVHAPSWTNLLALLLEARDFGTARQELARSETLGLRLPPALRQAIQAGGDAPR